MKTKHKKIKKNFRKNKKAFDMPFSWMFAIIVGAVILFLALYATSRFIDVAKYSQYTEAAKSITVLIDPLETGVASALGEVINFKQETRTYYGCYEPDASYAFGRQVLSFSEESGIKKQWASPGGNITIKNKFIFSEQVEQGKKLYVFSKPFFIGFKVSDIIMISSKEYCFISSPNIIQESLENLNLRNINLTTNINFCSEKSIKVCFETEYAGCDISVYGNEDMTVGYVIKQQGQRLEYIGNLVYAAIFSDASTYECNLKRLSKKISELAKVYSRKTEVLSSKGCDSIIKQYLDTIAGLTDDLSSYSDLNQAYLLSKQMDTENKQAQCQVYFGENY